MNGCGRGWIRAILVLLVTTGPLRAAQDDDNPQILRDGFESTRPSWTEEGTDATFVILRTHDRTNEVAHEGRYSERFVFEAGPGSGIHYRYTLPPSALSPTLKATLYVRSNRPGAQIFARVILPEAIDPDTGKPTPLLIAGTSLSAPDHWERLEITGLPLADRTPGVGACARAPAGPSASTGLTWIAWSSTFMKARSRRRSNSTS